MIEQYEQLGFIVLPVKQGEKVPAIAGWQNTKLGELSHICKENVGILLEPSNLVDVDIDCADAALLAPNYLPNTAKFGRKSKPSSHYIYLGKERSRKYTDTDGKCLLEIRCSGRQTVFPPSIHPSGEKIEWEDLDFSDWQGEQKVNLLAAATLLTRHAPGVGSRHDFALAIGGLLARLGWDESAVYEFVAPIFCQFSDVDRHIKAAVDSVGRFELGEPVRGSGALSEICGSKVVKKLFEFIKSGQNDLVRVPLSLPLSKQIDICVEALSKTDVFQTRQTLVGVVRTAEEQDGTVRASGTPEIKQITTANLVERLSELVVFVADEKQIRPNATIAQHIIERYQWDHIRPVDFVVGYPYLTKNWQVNDAQGVKDRVFSSNTTSVGSSNIPAKEAIDFLLEPFCDFPFADDRSRSAALAYLLTLLCRPAIDGPVPLFVFDGNTVGSGKTTLCNSLGYIALGENVPAGMFSKQEDEMRKTLVSYGLAGTPAVFFDNVKGKVQLPSLEAAITSAAISDRILGSSQIVKVPFRGVLSLSANNCTLTPDLARRSIYARLETNELKPALRGNFKYGKGSTLSMVRRFRQELLECAFSLFRLYANTKKVTTKPFGSFEEWAKFVAAPLIWAGLPDPTERIEEDDEDEADEALQAIVGGLVDAPKTAQQILSDVSMPVRDLFPGQTFVSIGLLGYCLRSNKGRVFQIANSRYKLVCKKSNGARKWHAVKI